MHKPPSRLSRVFAACLAAAVAATTLAIVPAVARPDGRPPSGAEDLPVSIPAHDTSTPQRLDPILAPIAEAKTTSSAHALAESSGVPMAGESVSVLVQAEPGSRSSAEKAVAAVGGKVTGSAGDVMRVSVKPGALIGLASSAGVLAVRKPQRPRKLGYTSEGVEMTNADRWHALGHDGAGAKIGIIDVGFYQYENLMTSGYLGSIPTSHTQVFDNSVPKYGVQLDGSTWVDPDNHRAGRTAPEPHGAAVAETAHDMAPGAEMYIAAIGDSIDLQSAVDWMHSNGVTIISMSLGWIGSPLDGGNTAGADNSVNLAVNKAANTYHMFWSNAAGNFRLNHWRGDFYDREGDYALNWDGYKANYNEFFYDGSAPIEGILWWRDSWTNAINDYDLMLFRWDDTLRGGKGDWQTVQVGDEGQQHQWGRSGDQPIESIAIPGGTLPPGWYSWALVNQRPWAQLAVSGQHRWLPANNKKVDFDFFCPNQDLQIDRPYRSIGTPADNQSKGFMAVAAVSAQWRTGGLMGRPGFGVQEKYSSEGPNQNGFVTPEIAAPDDTTNYIASTYWGGTTFRGTSAAAPHMAGAAALVQAAHPTWQGSDIEAYLKANALGMGDPGFDRKTGVGLVTLPATRSVDTQRLYGGSRYQTALAISKRWPTGSASSTVLASGSNFADALAGASLAGAAGCPVELTSPSAVTADLLAEMHRVTSGTAKPTVYLLGSEGAVSRTVANQLAASGFIVQRMNGVDRYDTAARIARKSLSARSTDTAFIVYGGNFPDALSAAPIAYKKGFPILPVHTGSIPSQIENVITSRGIKHAIIVGSTRVVAASVVTRLRQLGVTTVDRWYGASRYDTMRSVVDNAYAAGYATFGHLGVASGENFPDALAGAAETGRDGGFVLLTPPKVLGSQAQVEIGTHASQVTTVSVYGSELALQGAVVIGARVKSDH